MHTLMLVLALVLATIAGRGYSQPNPPPNPQSNPDAVPITGIEYLLAAGALYGAYRIRFSFKLSATPRKSLRHPYSRPITLPAGRQAITHNPARRQAGHNS